MTKQFVAYFYFVGWDCISLGFHLCLGEPNIEMHIPFGFIRIGWKSGFFTRKPINYNQCASKTFGFAERYP